LSSTAAPDEAALGKANGYPAAPTLAQTHQERYILGSFSAMDSLSPHCTLPASDKPLALGTAETETNFHYRFRGAVMTLDDYMQRQRATAVLVVKDGVIVAERYNYARGPNMRMLSNSMAKTITALALSKALEEGLIHSFDDSAATYAPELKGSLYGETRIVNLLRMASGARFVEDYTPQDDRARFNATVRREGVVAAAHNVTERADAEGERFNYAGAQTQVLGLVLGGATGKTLCDYVAEKIWQPLGAEAQATWQLNPVDQLELAQGGFNATVRDYARLGWLLANDGHVNGHTVLSREHVLDMTDATRQPLAFRPGHMQYKGSTYAGYGFQTWLLPGSHRRFALQGVYGQAIFVDPELKLVVVHTAVGKDASGDASGNHLGAERDAMFRGVVAQYGAW
jgi:CubicO group peptidase (beta-lactamase class C family)